MIEDRLIKRVETEIDNADKTELEGMFDKVDLNIETALREYLITYIQDAEQNDFVNLCEYVLGEGDQDVHEYRKENDLD